MVPEKILFLCIQLPLLKDLTAEDDIADIGITQIDNGLFNGSSLDTVKGRIDDAKNTGGHGLIGLNG